MNPFEKKRKALIIGFAVLCLGALVSLITTPGSLLGVYMVLGCLLSGYGIYLYNGSLKQKSAAWEKKRMTPQKKMRRELLEKDHGKVIVFPGPMKTTSGHRKTKE